MLVADVDEPRHPFLAGQAVDSSKKLLQTGERLFAFQLDQFRCPLLSGIKPAARILRLRFP